MKKEVNKKKKDYILFQPYSVLQYFIFFPFKYILISLILLLYLNNTYYYHYKYLNFI